MKFTEEQYQNIVDIAYEYRINSCFGIMGDTTQKSIGEEFYETELCEEIDFYDNAEEIMALFNPLTREWAHDKFVEKEKKCVWTSKKANSSGRHKRLFWQQQSASIRDYFTISENTFDSSEQLTESEIKAWGYNPDMFDREEMQ
ncbi:hypothetical protein [Leuconostoc mesenteroides]|uniref:hypothetical protein n=1 Tax=Leuconostoc mesenteroides TaxID=1245 RepID=UPI0006837FF0|nr:hypothetical protein [Leuconostoc mesenteroides]KMY76946.1 hypothetical protein WZ79_09915 [Leuconostoc mesenteroides subsp. mesenteroides]